MQHQIQQELTEMKSKCLVKAEGSSSSDIISTLPQTILETILSLLPTEEAARTSILSREWRYKWTKIPKLDFCLSQVFERINKGNQVKGKSMDRIRKLFSTLHQILLSHQGPIHEFTLDIDLLGGYHDNVGFDLLIRHLSKNHMVKKLILCGRDVADCYDLPISVFSLHHLTDLDLSCLDLGHQPISVGFAGLRSLVLYYVGISTDNLLHLLSNCPSLNSLTLLTYLDHHDRNCPIIELFECVPTIENLSIYMDVLKWVNINSVPKVLPTSLLHLKYFCFEDMCFVDGYGLGFLLVLIKCAPNLEKIKLETNWNHRCFWNYSVVWEEYSDVWLEHLNELEIALFRNTNELEIAQYRITKPEMEFMKFILARSPKLKKVRIQSVGDGEEKLKMVEVLSRAPRASPAIIYD
ncbi:hypothetical protein SSX86_025508 [Deinandra increscens subsp. villosa]|uniref:F-box domain-containing protein n=1 Tax=Deinandra increscens subsp. villosa TaxID=3103831 RepID=A0AAP0CDF4_9ASTR